LAGLLGSGLTSLTLLLDEPTRGLHPVEVEDLLEALYGLRDEGNTVIIVEHDPLIISAADYLIDMGPGAGQSGGRVVAQGTPEGVARSGSITGLWLAGMRSISFPSSRRQPSGWMVVRGARANNLRGDNFQFPLGVLVGVCGVSGSGKSTLVMDTLGRALAPRKQTTSVAYEPVDPGEHDAIEGAPARSMLVDQSRRGLHSPAAFLNLDQPLRRLFARSEDALALGLNEDQFARGCSACGGSGTVKMDMAFLPDVHLPCEACLGSGFLPEAWQVRLQGLTLPEVFNLTLDEVYDLFGQDRAIEEPLKTARQVGLGYLVLRQPGYALSGGEIQRLKIAQEMWSKRAAGTLYILDEPSIGQHLEDVSRLSGVFDSLVESGGSVIVVEHHPHILAACDWLLELGPGGGPEGGSLIFCGTPEGLADGSTPTSLYLRQVLNGRNGA